jgi:undecaprenyl-diphosphatase
MDFLFAILLGLIEGVTEYLPISSTGHLLVASELFTWLAVTVFKAHSAFDIHTIGYLQPFDLGLAMSIFKGQTFFDARSNGFRQTFDIVIQIGPILAILVYFRQDLWQIVTGIPRDHRVRMLVLNLILAFVPAGVVGLLIGKITENAPLIGATLLIGGIIFLIIEARPRAVTVSDLYAITPVQALIIGVAQITALIPGVSRSGATIVAGLLLGLRRDVITRFTFYLAIPTLVIATGYSLFRAFRAGELTGGNTGLLLVGTLVAFVSAYAAVAWFLRYVSTHDFRLFGVYRIVLGVIVLVLALFTPLLSY